MLNPTDRTRSLLGNTTVLTLAQISGMVVSLLLTPYIVQTLGITRFGLWAFLGSVAAYAGLLQFGLGKGTIRFIAYYGEREEFDVVRRIVSYGVLSHLAAGLVLSPLAWLIAREVLPHVHVSRPLLGTAETLFPLVFAYFFGRYFTVRGTLAVAALAFAVLCWLATAYMLDGSWLSITRQAILTLAAVAYGAMLGGAVPTRTEVLRGPPSQPVGSPST